MIQHEYRIVECYDKTWLIQSRRWTKEYFEALYPKSKTTWEEYKASHGDDGWSYFSGYYTYAQAKKVAERKIAEESFVGQVLYPPFPKAKKKWKFW